MDSSSFAGLQRFREPAAWIGLAVVAINIGVGVFRALSPDAGETVLQAMRSTGSNVMGLVSVILVLILVGACVMWEPPTVRARAVATTAAVIVGVGTLLTLANLVAGIVLSKGMGIFFELIGGGTDIVLKVLIFFILLYLARRVHRDTGTAAPLQQEAGMSPTTPRGHAVGARWGTAAQAAAGQQAEWGDASTPGWSAQNQSLPAASSNQPAQTRVVQPSAAEGPAARASRDLWSG